MVWHVQLPELAYDVLELNLEHLEPDDYLTPVQAKVPEVGSFYEQYQPLILDEVIAALKLSLERAQRKASRYGVHITPLDQIYYYSQDDITILKLTGQRRIDCAADMSSFRFIMAEVILGSQHYLGMIDIFQEESRLVLKGNLQRPFEESGDFYLIPLVSLLNLDRMYNVCCEMPNSSVLVKIRSGQTDPWPVIPAEVLTGDTRISPTLNDSQKAAVINFVDAEEGLYVLQGPPGTGKTTTIVEILRQLLLKPGRILVCAPSNKAVQVLAERSLQILPEAPLLLVSVGSKTTPRVESISMENWIQRYPRKLLTLVPEFDLTMQLLPSSIGGKSLLNSAGDLDFEKFNKCYQYLQQVFVELKEIIKICFRYTLLQPDLQDQFFQSILKTITNYFDLLDAVQKQIAAQAFPKLGAATVEPRPTKPNLTALRQNLNEQYAHLHNIVLDQLLNTVFPTAEDTLLGRARILFCTLSVSGRITLQRKCAQQEPFDIIVMDEAGQAVEAESLIPFMLAPRTKKVLLAGDTRQLPATTISRSSRHTHFEWSMMWRLLEENRQESCSLTVQYRMRRAIQHFPAHRYYEGKLTGHPSITQRRCYSEHFVTPDGCKFWIDTRGREERHETTFRNHAEALATVELVRAIRERDTTSQIGIISFYRGQIELIIRLMEVEKQKNKKISGHNITISTVDGFQGDEKDIIIVSFVRANDSLDIGFLHDFRRLNVAITRAKDVLIVLGNAETFARTRDNELRELLDFCQQANAITSLEILLKNIKGLKAVAKSDKVTENPRALPTVHSIGSVATHAAVRRSKGSHPQRPVLVSAVYTLEELLARAIRHYDAMQYEKAIESYNHALQRAPQRFDLYECLARCYDSMQATEDAHTMRAIGESIKVEAAERQEAQRLGTDIPKMHAPVLPPSQGEFVVVGAKKKILEDIKRARKLTDNRQFQEAEALYQRLNDNTPDHPEILLGLGWCMHKQRKNREAARYFELALTFDKSPLGYQGLILAKKYGDNIEGALDIACEGVDYFPYSKTLYRLKEELEQQAQSAVKMRQAFYSSKLKTPTVPAGAAAMSPTATPPTRPSLFFAPAGATAQPRASTPVYVTKASVVSASRAAQKVLEKGLQEARTLSESGQPAAAEKKYRDLLIVYPTCAEVLLGLGFALNRQHKNEAAIPYLTHAESLEKSSLVYQQLAIAHKHLGDHTDAMHYVTIGLTAYPTSPGLLALKTELAAGCTKKAASATSVFIPVFDLKKVLTEAKILCKQSQLVEALHLYEQALRHAPNHYDVLLGFAWVYNKQADYGRAIKFFERAMKVNPKDANVYYGLAIAFKGQDEIDRAVFSINHAVKLKPRHPEYRAFKEKLDELLTLQVKQLRL